jgi:hypothetical protein
MKISPVNLLPFLVLFLTSCHSHPPGWTYAGPAQITGVRDAGPCAGRVDGIAFSLNYDGKASEAIFIVGPGSGIWRSKNFTSAQPDWECLTDHIPLSSDAATDFMLRQNINDISNIVVSPANARYIYAGTNNSKSVILYSKDGGESWSVIPSSSFGNSYGVSHLFVDPAGILYVLLNDSFWKQDSPGGVTFSNLGTPFTEPVTLFGKGPYINFQDAVYTTGTSGQLDHIYVAVVEQNDPVAARTGIWSYDHGVWSQMFVEMVNIQKLPFFNADVTRIRMYANPRSGVVAAMTNDNPNMRNLKRGLLNTFQLSYNSKTKRFYWAHQWESPTMSFNTQENNDMGTCVDHNGIIYSGGVGLGQSDGNGGVVGVLPYGTCTNCNLHVDERVVVEYKNMIYVGTDGGIFRFNPGDHPGGFHDLISMNSPSLRNFLTTTVDRNNYAATFIVGGQDNPLSYVGPAGSQISLTSNENEYARFVPYVVGTPDKQIAYSFTPYNGFYKSTDGGKSFNPVNIHVPSVNGKFCFKKTEKGRMLMTVDNPIDVNGTQKVIHTVYETRNDWVTSRNIMASLQNVRTVTAVCYAGDLIIVATGQTILVSPDDGATWHIPLTADANVVAICSDPASPNSIYLATSSNSVPGKVFHCSLPADAAQPWTPDDFTGDIPGVVTNLNILSRGTGKWPYLFASLKNQDPLRGIGGPGLYQGIVTGKKTKTAHWKIFGDGLPDSDIRDIQVIPINPGTGKILVATFGRGAWQMEVTER